MPTKNLLGTVIGLAGIAAIAVGAWLLLPALGLVVIGGAAVYVGYRMGG